MEGDCLDVVEAAKGLLFRPERLTCRGRRVLPVNEGNMMMFRGDVRETEGGIVGSQRSMLAVACCGYPE